MIDMIKSCETESALEFLEESFILTEEQKRAVLQQKVIVWTNAMAEELQRETETLSEEERRQFNDDWANDEFLCYDEEAKQSEIPEQAENQMGEGSKRKRGDDTESSPKRLKPEDYFTIKSVKQVNVRKFKTTGTDYTVQFLPLNIHGVSDKTDIMSVSNSAFKHLFDRLTTEGLVSGGRSVMMSSKV